MKPKGLMPGHGLVPMDDHESSNQNAQNVELALKKKREKLALDKLHILPDVDDDV